MRSVRHVTCLQQVPCVSSKRLTEAMTLLRRIASPGLVLDDHACQVCSLTSLARVALAMSLARLAGHVYHITNITDRYEPLNV